jgi:hypothetical protein
MIVARTRQHDGTFLLAAFMVLLAASPCHAASRAQCRAACADEISACRAQATSVRARRRCKPTWVRTCRTTGLAACQPTTTTSTTSTTITTVTSSTTSTTLIFGLVGGWDFIATTIHSNTCPFPFTQFSFSITTETPIPAGQYPCESLAGSLQPGDAPTTSDSGACSADWPNGGLQFGLHGEAPNGGGTMSITVNALRLLRNGGLYSGDGSYGFGFSGDMSQPPCSYSASGNFFQRTTTP